MGRNPNPARTNLTRIQVLPRTKPKPIPTFTELEPNTNLVFKKYRYSAEPEQNRTLIVKESEQSNMNPYIIVVRTLVSAGELPLSCARLLAGWVTTLWLSRPLSVSQHGQLSHPSLRGR